MSAGSFQKRKRGSARPTRNERAQASNHAVSELGTIPKTRQGQRGVGWFYFFRFTSKGSWFQGNWVRHWSDI